MNAETVAGLMALIPERAARFQGGAAFELAASSCRYPERLAHVSKFLHWLSPLDALSNEDQQVLGLRNALGRPVHAADLEEDEAPEAEAGAESEEIQETLLPVREEETALA
jgi:hypothetical protein